MILFLTLFIILLAKAKGQAAPWRIESAGSPATARSTAYELGAGQSMVTRTNNVAAVYSTILATNTVTVWSAVSNPPPEYCDSPHEDCTIDRTFVKSPDGLHQNSIY
jgi:hypothetical protein